MKPILNVNQVNLQYKKTNSELSNLNFSLYKGQVLGILGESGSGKSTITKIMLGLLSSEEAKMSGTIEYCNQIIDVNNMRSLKKLRGSGISLIIQNPMTALNPFIRIYDHFSEILKSHRKMKKSVIVSKAEKVLRNVGLADTKRILYSYPHELSGGMLQRVMIALAIILRPKVLIADEATTALDAQSQQTVLNELIRIRDTTKTSIILVSHDIKVISYLADYVIVMKSGQIVDSGRVKDVIGNPHNEYTKELIKAVI